jgi:hypothetical protein
VSNLLLLGGGVFGDLKLFGVVVVIKDFGWGERDGGN